MDMNMNMNTGTQSQPSSSIDTINLESNKTTTEMSGMSGMGMSFFFSTNTPLFIKVWAPSSNTKYAASCIFLFNLAIVSRVLPALKARLEVFWDHNTLRTTYVTNVEDLPKSERVLTDSSSGKLTFTPANGEEEVVVIHKKTAKFPSWRLTVDPLRAGLDTFIAAVGFFLMLAVMTMNIGYFLSILVGTYIGSLAVGRFSFQGH